MSLSFFLSWDDEDTWHYLKDLGYDEAGDPEDADFLIFPGGADVNPSMYGSDNQGSRGWDDVRDQAETILFNQYPDKPKVGICRGAQLLNVLSGGQMVQDHGLVSGYVDTMRGNTFLVDHHQGMFPRVTGPFCEVLDVHPRYGTIYVGYYEHTKSLLFQPHPEWNHGGTDRFFQKLLEEYV